MARRDGRKAQELRSWKITRGVLEYAEGSALIEAGKTKVICAATVEERIPSWLNGGEMGWVTAEYAMLPRATNSRSRRERGGRIGGRTMEIQRIIGRSLRCVTDLAGFGQRTVTLDCDVIQADGGTRVASVTAAWVALHEAFRTFLSKGAIAAMPLHDSVAAVSVGVVGDQLLLDLAYDEDATAEVDMNVVITGRGRLVEVQATAEGAPFSVSRLNALVRLAQSGIKQIAEIQREALK